MFFSNTILIYKILKNYLKQQSKAKIIHFGSSGEYGKSDNVISEKNFLNPSSVYAGTKAAGTLILQAFSKQFKIARHVVLARPNKKTVDVFASATDFLNTTQQTSIIQNYQNLKQLI
jgi:nucleoside-diphosphate-sugar epimerase